ncbi:MAG: hypothetical protein AAF830_07255 [Pseudomonadota bacterium]
MRIVFAFIATLFVASACSEPDGLTPRISVDESVAPEVTTLLEARRSLVITTSTDDAGILVVPVEGGIQMKAATPSMERRDIAYADTIALNVDVEHLALIITARSHAMQVASGAAPDAVAQLRGLALELAEALNDTDPSLPLAEDLRTSYRQVLFQIAMTTRNEGDANALLAFEKSEAKEQRGVDVTDRFESARAWYYFASATHLTADMNSDREIAYAFSGFKDAQRAAIREREVENHTLRTDQDLIAARVRIGQLLTAISTLRDNDKLRDEADFAFGSAAGLWYDVMGAEETFCYRVDLLPDTEPRCIAPEDAELPRFVPS